VGNQPRESGCAFSFMHRKHFMAKEDFSYNYRALDGLHLIKAELVDGDFHLYCAEGDKFVYVPVGDCCSTTWIEHLEVPRLPPKKGALITAVEQIDMGSEDSKEHDCLAFYETRIKTTAGEVVVEYRNSSNGYYGGSLDLRSHTKAGEGE
jgi:hypothetical protein